jgi:hypothetical protein
MKKEKAIVLPLYMTEKERQIKEREVIRKIYEILKK